MEAEVEPSMMQTDGRSFNAEHVICGVILRRICTAANTPKLLCRWCRPGDHEDSKCPKARVNLITVDTDIEEVLAITRRQTEEKRKVAEAQAEIAKALLAGTSQLKDITGTLARNFAEQNIVR